MRATTEMKEMIEEAFEAEVYADHHGSKWPGMTYEQGVVAALRWAGGYTEDSPLED